MRPFRITVYKTYWMSCWMYWKILNITMWEIESTRVRIRNFLSNFRWRNIKFNMKSNRLSVSSTRWPVGDTVNRFRYQNVIKVDTMKLGKWESIDLRIINTRQGWWAMFRIVCKCVSHYRNWIVLNS